MQELMKSMRAGHAVVAACSTTRARKLGTEMLDTQFAAKMTGLPGGLSEAIARQLERQMGLRRADPASTPPTRSNAAGRSARRGAHPADRRRRLRAAAHRGGAQGARPPDRHPGRVHGGRRRRIETGWGRKEIRHADGTHVVQPVRHQGRRRLAGPGGRGHDDRVRRRPGAEGDGELPRLLQLRRVVRRLRAADEGQPALRARSWPAQAARSARTASRRACSAPATPPTRPTPTSSARVINTTLRLQRSLA